MKYDEFLELEKKKRKRKKPSNPEHELQVSCINWFRLQYRNKIIYAIPNGGELNNIVAAKLKAEGVLAGIPDLHVPIPNKEYHGLYIELKIHPNTPTDLQLDRMEQLKSNGYKCIVCYSLDEFMNTIKEYMNDTG